MAASKKAELEALVEQATVDAYDEHEQLSGFHVMLEEHLTVTVKKIDMLPGTGIVAICMRGPHRQAIGILDLPLPTPRPDGSEWIDAYRQWCR
ncbi:hypothetical protein [Planotetraspora sp. GP83]|uniref:hypothetical protein n=1 Tax=Planotetraspora sp. GP83 TaxID=3156264 RepID=UPI0035175BEE